MEKIINKLINDFTEGVDTYTHNGSTWLIFTESKQWVIELTDGKTLWYNYNFFKGIFSYTSMDVVDNQQYITKWVEDNVINKELTYATLFRDARDRKQQFEDALENGVKETELHGGIRPSAIEDAIQNGVKRTWNSKSDYTKQVNCTIQDGVKNTKQSHIDNQIQERVEGTIENGVKHIKMAYMKTDWSVENTIENGVKETNGTLRRTLLGVDDIIKNGVRDIHSSPYENVKWIDGVIKHGVKETSHRQFLKTYDVKDTIQDGTEHDRWILDGCNDPVDEVLDNGVKETNYDTDNYTDDVNEVIKEGVRTSHPRQYVGGDIVDKVIDKGVIETHDDVYHHKGRIDGVIKNGVKKTMSGNYNIPGEEFYITDQYLVDEVLENGKKINGTYAGGQRQSEKCKSVVEYGTKNPTD